MKSKEVLLNVPVKRVYWHQIYCSILKKSPIFAVQNADVAKLADALDLGSSAARHVGSTPIIRTKPPLKGGFFVRIPYLCSPKLSL